MLEPWRALRRITSVTFKGRWASSAARNRRLGNAWLSDRTVCYLATGRPAVVEHTGPSAFLPDDAGLFRFRGREEAAACLERVVEDYEHPSALAREVAANCFDARRVTARALEVAV